MHFPRVRVANSPTVQQNEAARGSADAHGTRHLTSLRMKLPALLVFLVLASAVILDAAEPSAPPNILFILADDMGWGAPSCYGNQLVATPHIDQLAAQGMRFTSAYADAQCSPTRAAFLSGQYGARSGLFKVIAEQEPPRAFLRPPEAVRALPPEVATLATTLRRAGYATGLSGKWHIADSHVAANLRRRNDGTYFDRYGFDFCGGARESEHVEDKAVTAIMDDIIGFIERSKGKPWFAFAAHVTTHTKLNAPKALVDAYAARGYTRSSHPGGLFAERPTAEYLAMLEHFDHEIGRVLTRLDELRLSDNTVVVFASDNGGLSRVADNRPLREGKGSPYEGGIRVPVIVRWPGVVRPHGECDVPIHFVDFYPTFAALAGATPPADFTLDGESLLPLWQQTGSLNRTAIYWHMPTYTVMYGRTPCSVIRQGDWKLIHWFGDYLDTSDSTPDTKPYGKLVIGQRTELYNLRDDLGEAHDLAAAKPEKTAQLKAALEAWWQETGAPFPEKNPAYDPTTWWTGSTVVTRPTRQ
jgi:arylsulfatase A